VLNGTAAPFTAVTAVGFADPAFAGALGFELGLGLELPELALDAVMIEFAEVEDVLMFELPSAERT
jgi:hypothetical protein